MIKWSTWLWSSKLNYHDFWEGCQKTALKNIFKGSVLNPLIKSHEKLTFRGGVQNISYKSSILMIFIEGGFQNVPPKVKFSWLLGGVVKTPPWKIYLGVVFLKSPPNPWELNFYKRFLRSFLQKLNSHDFRGVSHRKITLKNTFRGGCFRPRL